jgi:hypothetical protein
LLQQRPPPNFNGDSKADIIWQHDNGLTAMWQMDGTSTLRPIAALSQDEEPGGRLAGMGGCT